MKLLLLQVLMAVVTVAQILGEEIDTKEETDYWTSNNQMRVRTRITEIYNDYVTVINSTVIWCLSCFEWKFSIIIIIIIIIGWDSQGIFSIIHHSLHKLKKERDN